MNVLSLFDGMSGGQIALKELGIIPEKYYASEIDKHAIAQTKLNFPNTIHLGSVVDVDVTQLEPIDLLIGGSPCQSFSFAGKRKGMATKSEIEITKLEQYLELKEQGFEFEGQSYLFWEYMRILTDIRQYNPDVIFLLENVEMGSKWEQVLSEAIGIFGVHINSALVSAQNRKRIYWTNIKTRTEGLFGELYSDIPQPEDRGILLRDILEDNVDEKYFLSDKMNTWLKKHSEKNKNKGNGFGLKIKEENDKCSCLTSGQYRQNLSADYLCVAMRGRDGVQQLEPNNEGKTNCITSVQKDNLVVTSNYIQLTGTSFDSDNRFWFENGKHAACVTRGFDKTGVCIEQKDNLVLQINQSKESGGKQPYQHNRVYNTNGISPCLNTDARAPSILTIEDYKIRRLTPTECSRLQTIPDWYVWECSDTQQYKLLGNGWTIEVIKHILKELKNR